MGDLYIFVYFPILNSLPHLHPEESVDMLLSREKVLPRSKKSSPYPNNMASFFPTSLKKGESGFGMFGNTFASTFNVLSSFSLNICFLEMKFNWNIS